MPDDTRIPTDPDAARWAAVLARDPAPATGPFLYAVTTGQRAMTSAFDLIFRDVAVRGFWLYRPPFKDSAKAVEAMKLSARLIAEGKLRFPVAATYPLSSATAALAHAQKGGKVLFAIAP